VMERSTRGTDVYVSQARTGSNLVDLGRERCVPIVVAGCGGVGELLGRYTNGGREATVKCCGLAVARPQGQSRAPLSSSEWSVNTGTVPVLALRRAASAVAGLGPSSADRVGTGRSRRSSPRPGEPVTWRRAAAVRRRDGGCNAERRTAEWRRTDRGWLDGSAPTGIGDAGQASPLGGGRPWSPVRRPVQPRARPGDAACGVRAGRGQHRGPERPAWTA